MDELPERSIRTLKWLTKNATGRRILRHAFKEVIWDNDFQNERDMVLDTHRKYRSAVVVEVSADGWIEAYGPSDVTVEIVNRPAANTPEDAQLIDEFIERHYIPRRCRPFYKTSPLAADQAREVTVSDWLTKEWEVLFLRTMKKVGESLNDD